MSDRETLTQGDDGGWYRACGCRFDYFDGKPSIVALDNGKSSILGVVAPHVHLCAEHAAETGRMRAAAIETERAIAHANDPSGYVPKLQHGAFVEDLLLTYPGLVQAFTIQRRAQDAEAAVERLHSLLIHLMADNLRAHTALLGEAERGRPRKLAIEDIAEGLRRNASTTRMKMDATQPAPSDGEANDG